MKKNGFTLVEVLGVVAILAILIAVSVPIYSKIKNNILAGQYKNVKTRIETAAEKFASDTKIITVSVEDLIKKGYLSPDDETDIYNPIDNSSLNCKIVETRVSDDGYTSSLTNNGKSVDGVCSEYAVNVDSLIEANCEDDKCNLAYKNTNGDWYSGSVKLTVKSSLDKKISSYRWLSLTGDTSDEESVLVTTDALKTTTYTLSLAYEDGSTEESYIDLKIDNQNPSIIDIVKDDNWSNDKKKVVINATDGMGSQVREYLVSKNNTCEGTYQESNTFSLDTGTYYACVKDNAGNVSEAREFSVVNIDRTKPEAVLNGSGYFTTYSKVMGITYYSELTRKITFRDSESLVSKAKYCFTSDKECTPNKDAAVKQQEESEVLLSYETNKKATRVCVEAYDGAGNKSDLYCDDTFLVDKTKPTNVKVTTNKTSKVTVSASDGESDIYKMICKYGTSSNNLNMQVEAKNGVCDLGSSLDVGYTYYVRVDAYNNANLVESSKIESLKIEKTIDDAYIDLCHNKSYCDGPMFINYNGNLFVVYAKSGGYKSIYYNVKYSGYFGKKGCCNQGNCTYENSAFIKGDANTYLNSSFLSSLPSYTSKLSFATWQTNHRSEKYRSTSAYVGLLSYDEYQSTRYNRWMYEGAINQTFWLSTPYNVGSGSSDGYQEMYLLTYNGYSFSESHNILNSSAGFRPVVVFKRGIKFVKGNGSFSNPYVV